ncbi:MAG: DNA polymerase III subunit gamma/tau [Candidatus Dasytiphilus stammeri]
MIYQVLARKWRPKFFSEVIGQDYVISALENSLILGRIHHAYLFSGTSGIGKTTIARLLAKGLNCETSITATPCGQCTNCQQITQGNFIDLIEIDAASRAKVEEMRELLENIQYAPVVGRYKIYLIDEVHMLSRHSFNALLKTLEEPPVHVKFLLATTDPQKLPITILSRCLQFHLKILDVDHIFSQLVRICSAEQITAESRALKLISRAADGSMRDALSMVDQAIILGNGKITVNLVKFMLQSLDDDEPLALIEALFEANGKKVIHLLNQLAIKRAIDWESILIEMLCLLHHIAMVQFLADKYCDHDKEINIVQRLQRLANTMSTEDVQLYYQILLSGRQEISLAPNKKMGVEMTLLRALTLNQPHHLDKNQAINTYLLSPNREPALPITSNFAVRDSHNPSDVSNLENLETNNPVLQKNTNQILQALNKLVCRKNDKPDDNLYKENQSKSRVLATRPPLDLKKNHLLPLENFQIKNPQLAVIIDEEVRLKDLWAADIAQLSLPPLVRKLALNCWREQQQGDVIVIHLHLRSNQRHLNTPESKKILADAISQFIGKAIEISIIEDDNLRFRTPLEWRKIIYEEKLAHARQSINNDKYLQILCRSFNSSIDEESILPICRPKS